jgi:hypothetical protein
MRKLEQDESWVIYQLISRGAVSGGNAVCEQAEWDEMERIKPGAQSLVQCGIASEGVAERLARGTSGDSKPRVARSGVAGLLLVPGPSIGHGGDAVGDPRDGGE